MLGSSVPAEEAQRMGDDLAGGGRQGLVKGDRWRNASPPDRHIRAVGVAAAATARSTSGSISSAIANALGKVRISRKAVPRQAPVFTGR
jgi:hypothetical protein